MDSVDSLDNVQGTVDIVHGHCPASLNFLDFVHCVHGSTLSTDTLDKVQADRGLIP